LFTANGAIDGFINCIDADHYRFSVPADQSNLAAVWLRDLSDGFIVSVKITPGVCPALLP